MKVLVACEYSGRVRQAFRRIGHEAWSFDLLPAEDDSPYHIQRDVLEALDYNWDLMIAHPPCTFLCNSGVRWLSYDPGRWDKMTDAANFFLDLLEANIKHIAIENPIMHRYAQEIIQEEYTQIIHPWQFGHGETKSTCLWLKNLTPLKPANVVPGRVAAVHYMSPRTERWKDRSRTYEGIANAMADQWGNL